MPLVLPPDFLYPLAILLFSTVDECGSLSCRLLSLRHIDNALEDYRLTLLERYCFGIQVVELGRVVN